MKEKSKFGSKQMDWAGMWWLLPMIAAAVTITVWMGQPRGEPPNLIGWIDRYEIAADLSKQTGKPVLIDFTQDACGPCRRMDLNVFGNKQVASVINKQFIPLRIDVTPRNHERFGVDIARQYAVSGTPTLIITDSDGTVISRRDHSLENPQILAWLNSVKPATANHTQTH